MGKVACPDNRSTEKMVGSPEIHKRGKRRGNNQSANKRSDVSPDEEVLMKKLREEGKKPQEIADILNRAISCVYNHLNLGVRRPRWTDDDNQILVDGYLAKLPPKIIAGKLNRSPTAIKIAWCRHKKQCRGDPKKQYTLSMIGLALKAVRKADIYRELEVVRDDI